MDGIDAALLDFSGKQPQLINTHTTIDDPTLWLSACPLGPRALALRDVDVTAQWFTGVDLCWSEDPVI